MQKISSYLYSNKVDINLDLALSPMEWRIVYQRNVKIYKGYSNTIELDIKNAQQKRFDVSELTMKCLVMDDLNQEVYTADVLHTGTPITISSFASKSGTSPCLVTFTIPTQTIAPTVGNAYTVTGNSNALYNGTYIVTSSSTSSITLRYSSDPGTYGTGTTVVAQKLATGIATFTVPAEAIVNLAPQFLKYTVYVLNEDDTKSIVYGDTQFGATGKMELIDTADVIVPAPEVIKTFTYLENTTEPIRTYYSESVIVNPKNDNDPEPTIELEFLPLGLAAEVKVQVTYDKVIATANTWVTVETFNLASTTSTLTKTYVAPDDFTNEVNWLRITYVRATDNTGKFDRINVRM
jgi:hypothetical protein